MVYPVGRWGMRPGLTLGGRRCGLLRRSSLATRRRDERHGHWVTDLQHLVDMDFNVIHPGRLKAGLREKRAVRDMMVRAGKREVRFALAQHRFAIGSNKADQFREIPNTSRPAVEHAKLQRNRRELRDVDVTNDADEDEIAGSFLANVFSEQRSLEIREDTGRIHVIDG